MDTRQHHAATTVIPERKNSNTPTFLSEAIRTIVELPFWLFLLTTQILRDSPVVQKCYDICIDVSIHTIQRITQDPIIQRIISNTISEGMNHFIQQPDLDQLLLHMVTSISKSQPDIARQQGQDFPIVVSSFVQGILQHAVNRKSPQKVNPLNKNNSHNPTDEASQHIVKPQQLSFEPQGTEAVECSIINDINGLNVDSDHVAAADFGKDETDEVETLNEDLIVSTSSSSSSMVTVTAPRTTTTTTTVPTNQHILSVEHDVVELSVPSVSSSQVDEQNNQLSHVDDNMHLVEVVDSNEAPSPPSAIPHDETVRRISDQQRDISDSQRNKHNNRWW